MGFSQSYLDRFSGIINLYGKDKARSFLNAKVLVIGLGGVGSWIVEALVRSGVGHIILMDLDDVCLSNFNRQLVAIGSSLGNSKVEVMASRCLDINLEVQITKLEYFVTKDNIASVINDYDPSVVVDAIDCFRTKAAVISRCLRTKTPIVTIGSSGGKIDPSQVRLNDLARTVQDPLFSKVKSDLRKNYGFNHIGEKDKFKVHAIYSCEPTKRSIAQVTSCVSFGSVSHLTSTYANFATFKILELISE